MSRLHALQTKWGEHRVRRLRPAILATPPLAMRDAPLIILTLIGSMHVTPYLAALKSLYPHLGAGRAVVLDDGTLTAADQEVLRDHIPLLELCSVASIRTGEVPRGNCWERLLLAIDLSAEAFVIQMDCDTLTLADPEAVRACIAANRSYALGTDIGLKIQPAAAAVAPALQFIHESVGRQAEALLPSLPGADDLLYVCASAGFAGFAQGAHSRDRLTAFSQAMHARMGEDWTRWGTEQIASNIMVANAAGAIVLPYPDYACFEPGVPEAGAVFRHFYGTFRYQRGVYLREMRRLAG